MGVLSFGYGTSAGIVRQENEDSLCVRPDIGLWAVADGMGGYKGGETASRITVEQLAEDAAAGMPLAESISGIHHRIVALARTDSAYESMGSTVVAVKTDGKVYEVAWVGDSRAYLWDGRELSRLTRDHSYIQYLIDSGVISEADALEHPERHVILQALGAEEIKAVDVDVVRGGFRENEKILLCSDGLTNEVGDSQISSILRQPFSEQVLVDHLIAAAKENGGSDNISAILIAADSTALPEKAGGKTPHNPSGGSPPGILRPDAAETNYPFWFLMVIVLLVLFLSVMFVYDIL